MKMQIRAPAGDGGRRKKKKCGEMIVGGTEKISSFLSRSWFLVPGSWFLSTFHVASYLVPHSDFAFGIKVLQPFLALLRMYVSSVVRSLLLSSPILHTIVLIIIIRIFRIQGSSCFFVGLFFRLCLHQCFVTHLHHQT